MPRIETDRLILIPGTVESSRAELTSLAALSAAIDADIAEGWPPELYDEDAIRWTLAALEEGRTPADWGFYYFAERRGGMRPLVVGAGGFKGGPDDSGAVEIGYSVVSERRRRGYAREAVYGMLGWAFADPRVSRVIAHTLVELVPSIGVLESTGFTFVGAGADPSEPSAIQYVLERDVWRNGVLRAR